MAALIVVLLCAFLEGAAAWRTSGVIPAGNTSGHTVYYAGKFCFDYVKGGREGVPDAGIITLHIHGRVAHQNGVNGLFFMALDDEPIHWPYVRRFWNELSCVEWQKAANKVVALAPPLATKPFDYTSIIHVHEQIRPRFWYFAFIDCGTNVLEPLNFELHTRNVDQGVQAEFGMDERSSLMVEMLFGAIFALLALAISVTTWSDTRSRPLLHLLQASAACSALGCLCFTFHNLRYAQDGMGLPFAMILSTLLGCLSKALLVVLQYLIIKGWALVYDQAEQQRRSFITITFGAIVALTVGCEIHGEFFQDQSVTLFLYDSWPGHLILALNMVLLGGALLLMHSVYSKETSPEVRSFYRFISAANLIFFGSLPLVCLLAASFHPWVRRKYVERSELIARLVSTSLFLFCLWPSNLDAMVSARPAKSSAPLDFEEPAEGEEGKGLASDGDGA